MAKAANPLQLDLRSILLAAHPVGSYYWSSDPTSPATLFGGTWTQITDCFVYAAGSKEVGATGGAESVSYTPAGTVAGTALTASQMPAHTHDERWPAGYSSIFETDLRKITNPSNTTNKTTTYRVQVDGTDAVASGTSFAGYGAVTTDSTGGGQAHTHGFTGTEAEIQTMPPYVAAYCWRRTA